MEKKARGWRGVKALAVVLSSSIGVSLWNPRIMVGSIVVAVCRHSALLFNRNSIYSLDGWAKDRMML